MHGKCTRDPTHLTWIEKRNAAMPTMRRDRADADRVTKDVKTFGKRRDSRTRKKARRNESPCLAADLKVRLYVRRSGAGPAEAGHYQLLTTNYQPATRYLLPVAAPTWAPRYRMRIRSPDRDPCPHPTAAAAPAAVAARPPESARGDTTRSPCRRESTVPSSRSPSGRAGDRSSR